MQISVLVPTFRRTDDLRRCLDALAAQSRLADEVIVTVRPADDLQTVQMLEERQAAGEPLPLRTVPLSVPGQVAALNAGVEAARGDVIAITDDDAAPHPDWLARIEEHFARDAHVGAVGGRDWPCHDPAQMRDARSLVGRVQWHGRTVGNHHLGVGHAREVEMLKGVNMSYRRAALGDTIRFDTRLRGNGSEINNDMAFSLAVRRAGWKVIYDPLVAVDHHPAARHDEDQRGAFNAFAATNIVHNETVTLLEYLPPARRMVYFGWALLVGVRAFPGVLHALHAALVHRAPHAGAQWRATLKGRFAGLQTYRSHAATAARRGRASGLPAGPKKEETTSVHGVRN